MSSLFAGVRAIVYDLDGTLYTDTHHFAYYARRLADRLPGGRQEAFLSDWAAAAAGRHALRVGTCYDAGRDWILICNPEGRVLVARDWNGAVQPEASVAAAYPGPLTPDHTSLLNVGDLWWVPAAVAAHHGLAPEDQRAAFLETRVWMAGPEFTLQPVPGLHPVLAALRDRGVVQALATNSPQPDSDALLAKAGLGDLLAPKFYSCGKPAGFTGVVRAICEAHGLTPGQLLSVGDNYMNDLAPARTLGCLTAYIDGHGTGSGLPCGLRVGRVEDLLPHLAGIGA